MFEKVQRALSTFFSSSRLYLFAMIVALVAILQLAYMYSDKFTTRDMMTSGAPDSIAPSPAATDHSPAPVAATVSNPSDLLPHDVNSQWGELNPMNKDGVNTPDLLQAGYHIGLDTIGQTMRNANLQERSDPVIAKSNIGPWNQSTIEPDLARTPLELGVGPR